VRALFALAFGVAVSVMPKVPPARADLVEVPEDGARAPASRYANMTDEEALAELGRRQIRCSRVESAPGVRTPIRLQGPLRGVWFHSSLPEEQRRTTPFEILDARLALALDDFAVVLSNHDIVEVVHFTMYRPGDEAQDAHSGEGAEAPQVAARHPGGLAIDVGAVKKRTGGWLTVATHWAPALGAKTCGRGARRQVVRRGRELVSLACEIRDLRLFHAVLTPHFNRAHHDHLHLEIKPDTKWFIIE
jgi:hypothetical protein